MSNNSATGGYLVPSSSSDLPGGLSLNQFIQTVLVGISDLPGTMVRPQWQVAPPKQPDINVNWLAYGIAITQPDTYAYVTVDEEGVNHTQRHQLIEVQCSFYGPDAMERCALTQDGFQITQNLEALRLAGMGFVETTAGNNVPDLINERFVNRVQTSVFLRREVRRTYPILSILSASGTIHTELDLGQYLIDWDVENEET